MEKKIKISTNFISIIWSFLFFLFSASTFGQATIKLEIDGIVKDEETGNPIESSTVEIFSGGSVIKTIITTVTGKFIFDVDPEVEYVLKCSKGKYVSKMVTISTIGINDKIKNDQTFKFPIAVRLFKEMPDLDVSVLNQPIGSIFFDPSAKEFDYNVDKVLKKRLEKLQEEVEKKIKLKAEAEKLKKEKEENEAKLNAELEAKAAKEKLKNEAKNAELEKQKQENASRQMEEEEKRKKAQAIEDEKRQSENLKKSQKQAEEEAEKKRLQAIEDAKNEKENQRKLALEEEKRKKEEKKKELEEVKKLALEKAKEKIAKKVRKENDSVPIAAAGSFYAVENPGPVIENVRQTVEEGLNFTIIHTFCLYNGDPIEFKKITFTWGGVYYKKNNNDISDLTYNLEMRSVNPESAEPPK